MERTTFVLSDEKVAMNGIKIITNGINLKKFKEKPIMKLIDYEDDEIIKLTEIGYWDNIRIEGGKLLASPKFDNFSGKASWTKSRLESYFVRKTIETTKDISLKPNGNRSLIQSKNRKNNEELNKTIRGTLLNAFGIGLSYFNIDIMGTNSYMIKESVIQEVSISINSINTPLSIIYDTNDNEILKASLLKE